MDVLIDGYANESTGKMNTTSFLSEAMWKRALAEFLGTALMVGIGCGSIAFTDSSLLISIAFGIAVTLAILIFGPISGAHINSAVTIAFWIHGDLEGKAVIPYIVAQLLGGIFAAVVIGPLGPTVVADNVSIGLASIIEVSITFLLMASILVIISKTDNRFAVSSLVGLSVTILAFIFGRFTGASMNPARTLGPNLMSGELDLLWMYFLTCITGASLASLYFNRLKQNPLSVNDPD